MKQLAFLITLVILLIALTTCILQTKAEPDQYEPNNSFAEAFDLGSLGNDNLVNLQANFHDLKQDQYDWFRVFVEDSSTSNSLGVEEIFELNVQLSAVPDGNNYDLFLYSDEKPSVVLTSSINGGNQNEAINYAWTGKVGGDDSRKFYIEIRYISGPATENHYTLEINFKKE